MSRHQMQLTDKFRFGKHIGSTLEDVIENDSKYITWAVDEGVVRLNNDAYNVYADAVED